MRVQRLDQTFEETYSGRADQLTRDFFGLSGWVSLSLRDTLEAVEAGIVGLE